MKEIDWREAPGCAVAALVATTDNVHYPSVEFVTGYHAYGCMIRATSAVDGRSLSAPSDCWFLVDRPVSPWIGEGLPPIGEIIEWLDGEYLPVIVVGHHQGAVVAVDEDDPRRVFIGKKPCYRPLRTPEQIATEERDAAINEMIRHIKDHPSGRHGAPHLTQLKIQEEACCDLYDAGYRRVEL